MWGEKVLGGGWGVELWVASRVCGRQKAELGRQGNGGLVDDNRGELGGNKVCVRCKRLFSALAKKNKRVRLELRAWSERTAAGAPTDTCHSPESIVRRNDHMH